MSTLSCLYHFFTPLPLHGAAQIQTHDLPLRKRTLYFLRYDLDLDNYVAEPFSIYATGESWESLFSPGGDGLPEAVHCLCAHNTFFKMVPIDDSFWKERVIVIVECISYLALWHNLFQSKGSRNIQDNEGCCSISRFSGPHFRLATVAKARRI